MQKAWGENTQPQLSAQKDLLELKVKKLAGRYKVEDDLTLGSPVVQELTLAKRELAAVCAQLKGPCWFVEDCTQEALVNKLGEQNGKMSMVSSDARKVIKNLMGLYKSGGTDEDVLLKAFSGDSIRVDRIGRDGGPVVQNPQLSALLVVQPDLFEQFVGHPCFLESGLVPRFLIADIPVIPQYVTMEAVPLSSEVDSVYTDWLNGITVFRDAVSPNSLDINAEQGAREIINTFTNECVDLQRGELSDIGSCVARWGELTWRLALVLHVAHFGQSAAVRGALQQCFAANAVRLMKWFASQQVKALNVARHKKKAVRLSALIDCLQISGEDGCMSVRDLVNNHGFKKPELEQLVADSQGVLVMETLASTSKGGRPSLKVRIAE